MGILDSLITTKSKSREEAQQETSTKTTAKEDINRRETTTIGQTEEERRREEETQRGQTEAERTTSQLSTVDLERLRALTGLLTEGVVGADESSRTRQLDIIENLGTTSTALEERAGAIPDVIENIVGLSKTAATNEFERTRGREIEGTIEGAGSALNTFSELLRNEGAADLGAQLGSIEAQTRLGGENLIADLLAQAGAGRAAAATALTDIQTGNVSRALSGFELLRGAETTERAQETEDIANLSTGTRTSAAETRADVLETILRDLVQQSTSTTTGRGSSESSVRESPISVITGLVGAFR